MLCVHHALRLKHPSVQSALSRVPDRLGLLALVARLTSELMTWMPQCLLRIITHTSATNPLLQV